LAKIKREKIRFLSHSKKQMKIVLVGAGGSGISNLAYILQEL
jgi:hypothetical protein